MFTVSSQPGKIFGAKLSRTSGILDQQDRSLKLEFDVNNSNGELQGGDTDIKDDWVGHVCIFYCCGKY